MSTNQLEGVSSIQDSNQLLLKMEKHSQRNLLLMK